MFATWQVEPPSELSPLRPHHLLFSLRDLGGMDGISRWLEVSAKHRTALGRVMGTRYARAMFVSDRVLNCAAALEGYDRDSHPAKCDFGKRIRRLAGRAGDTFEGLVGDVPAWVKTLTDVRNDVAHHRARAAVMSSEQYFLGESAYWLFVLCMLRDAEAPPAVFGRISQHPQLRWLRHRITEVLTR